MAQSERTAAGASSSGSLGLGGIMWAADHYHWQWFAPVAALMTFVFAALTLVSALLWCHLGWRWVRSRGLRLGPAIFIVIGLLIAAGGGVWGMFTWSPSGKRVAGAAPKGADETAKAKIAQYGATPPSQRDGDRPDARGIVGGHGQDEPGNTVGPMPTAEAIGVMRGAGPAARSTGEATEQGLLVECQSGGSPKKFDAEGNRWEFTTFYTGDVPTGGSGRRFGTPGTDIYPADANVPAFAWKCTVTNYNNQPIVNIVIPVTLHVLKREGQNSFKIRQYVKSGTSFINIAKIEAGKSFTFYAFNGSKEDAISVEISQSGICRYLSEDENRNIRVVTNIESGDLVLMPNGGFL